MKTLRKTIIETNLNKIQAYSLANNSSSLKASDYRGITFKILNYVLCKNVISNSSTEYQDNAETPLEVPEEIQERTFDTLTIETEDHILIGTNSVPMIAKFFELQSLLDTEDIKITEVSFIIREGTGKSGRTFNSLEFIL